MISRELVHLENELDTSTTARTRNACIGQCRNEPEKLKRETDNLIDNSRLLGSGCCSTKNDFQRLSTSDLQLRRYELMYCLSMTRMSWDKRRWQSNAYDHVKDDLEEKEAIEREITRRGVTDYHWPPSVTYRYVHDHCHCQCWVVTL